MKKFMKAIAFATVMCMLLSVAAFAAETDGSVAWGEESAVRVTINAGSANANKQIALVVSTAASAGAIATGNIYDVQQVALDENGSKTVALSAGGQAAVNVFYGYEGRDGGDAGMLELAAQAVTPDESVVIYVEEILTEAEIAELAKTNESIVATDNDYAGAIIATVTIDAGDKTVSDMMWSIRHNGEKGVAYVKADTSIFTVLDGSVQYALSFSNGNKSGLAEVEVTGLEAIVKLSDGSEIYSDEEFDKPNKLDAQ